MRQDSKNQLYRKNICDRKCRGHKEPQISAGTAEFCRMGLPVYGEGLACWLLLGHTDDAGRAAVGTAKPRASHTVGPAAHPDALTDLRVVQHVPRVHRQCPPVNTSSAPIRCVETFARGTSTVISIRSYFHKAHESAS